MYYQYHVSLMVFKLMTIARKLKTTFKCSQNTIFKHFKLRNVTQTLIVKDYYQQLSTLKK